MKHVVKIQKMSVHFKIYKWTKDNSINSSYLYNRQVQDEFDVAVLWQFEKEEDALMCTLRFA